MMAETDRKVLARGWTSTIYETDSTGKRKIVKVVDRDNAEELFRVEREVYNRISRQRAPPGSLLEYFGVDTRSEFGLVLEKADKGSFWEFFPAFASIRLEERNQLLRKWARQAVEALSFVHQLGILHCDIHASNFFLDKDMNLKLADFGAASIDGQRPVLMYRRTHQLWVKKDDGSWKRDYSVASEIFALGCVFYNMETFKDAVDLSHDEETRDEIKRRLIERDLPDTKDLPALGKLIQKCWNLDYQSMNDLLVDLEELPPTSS